MIPLRDNVKSQTFPLVNYILIAMNVAAFFYQIKINSYGYLEKFIYEYGVVPAALSSDPLAHWTTLISSQFIHGGFAHLIGNMVFLYIFGDNIEDKLGHIGYIFFYILCGSLAALTQVFFTSGSSIPMIGASGAIAGVLGAYFLFYPRSKIMTLIPLGFFSRIIEVPAFFFLGFWFLMQTFSGTSAIYAAKAYGQDVGGVAWWAHAGGFVSGLIMAIFRKI